jgi:hypothetical protein
MDRSAALLERAKNVQTKNREIEEIIAGLQGISLEPQPHPRPSRALPWLLAPALAVTFAAGVWAGGWLL